MANIRLTCFLPFRGYFWPPLQATFLATNSDFGHSGQSGVSENGPKWFPMPKNLGIDTRIKSLALPRQKLQFLAILGGFLATPRHFFQFLVAKTIFWPIINMSHGLSIKNPSFGMFKLVLGWNIRPATSKTLQLFFYQIFQRIRLYSRFRRSKMHFFQKLRCQIWQSIKNLCSGLFQTSIRSKLSQLRPKM